MVSYVHLILPTIVTKIALLLNIYMAYYSVIPKLYDCELDLFQFSLYKFPFLAIVIIALFAWKIRPNLTSYKLSTCYTMSTSFGLLAYLSTSVATQLWLIRNISLPCFDGKEWSRDGPSLVMLNLITILLEIGALIGGIIEAQRLNSLDQPTAVLEHEIV